MANYGSQISLHQFCDESTSATPLSQIGSPSFSRNMEDDTLNSNNLEEEKEEDTLDENIQNGWRSFYLLKENTVEQRQEQPICQFEDLPDKFVSNQDEEVNFFSYKIQGFKYSKEDWSNFILEIQRNQVLSVANDEIPSFYFPDSLSGNKRGRKKKQIDHSLLSLRKHVFKWLQEILKIAMRNTRDDSTKKLSIRRKFLKLPDVFLKQMFTRATFTTQSVDKLCKVYRETFENGFETVLSSEGLCFTEDSEENFFSFLVLNFPNRKVEDVISYLTSVSNGIVPAAAWSVTSNKYLDQLQHRTETSPEQFNNFYNTNKSLRLICELVVCLLSKLSSDLDQSEEERSLLMSNLSVEKVQKAKEYILTTISEFGTHQQ